MQQAYVLAYTRLQQFARGARFSTWLLRIGVNEALQRLAPRAAHGRGSPPRRSRRSPPCNPHPSKASPVRS